MLFFLMAVVSCVLLHVLAMALLGVALGVTLREVSIGVGPTLLRVGRWRIRLLPVGGAVRFQDSRDEAQDARDADVGEPGAEPAGHEVDTVVPTGERRQGPGDGSPLDGALDQRSPASQMAIGLAGCMALVALACGVWQADGIRLVMAGFPQIIAGALSPFGAAQDLIASAKAALAGLSFIAVLGLVAAKVAAFNLLPLPGANGGFALAVIGRALGLDRFWPASLTAGLLLAYIAIGLSWLVALGYHGLR